MKLFISTSVFAALLATGHAAIAFDSGSTGADGAFNPTVSTVLDMPSDGVFNFTDVNIPAGVTVTFNKNATNTPVVMLASGNVAIAGTLAVWGGAATHVGAAGNGATGDDGLPGRSGPGGFDGGQGGPPTGDRAGGDGLGPGGGQRGTPRGSERHGGAGGSFGSKGKTVGRADVYSYPGPTYGSALLLPLIGGSGGGGGMGGNTYHGSGGGGGGGAILIAASGSVTVSGALQAGGGRAGDTAGGDCGCRGGGGSGGGIRIVATSIAGNGTINAGGAPESSRYSCTTNGYSNYGDDAYGGSGRVRLEAETITRTAATTPTASVGEPGELYVAGLPSLRISSVAGVDAPASPTGSTDITLPSDTSNPVAVTFETTGIPVGNIVNLTMTPSTGGKTSTVSNALSGTTESATASASINLPSGPSTLSASVTYTITLAMAENLKMYAGGETIEQIKVTSGLSGQLTQYWLVTESGREVPIAKAHLASAG